MDHDHGAMTTTTSAGMSAATDAASMGSSSSSSSSGMGGMGGGCKISMLWNWYTIDSCFIASSWRVTSAGMFAGSCIGVVLLVMALELLRRSVKEYDRFLIRRHLAATAAAPGTPPTGDASAGSSTKGPGGGGGVATSSSAAACSPALAAPFRPTLPQQAVRALLHMMQFAVAYFVMLLAMYYNGYIIICIFIGSYLGYFVFGWETLVAGNRGQTSAANEATVCCG
ncbi:hypothetical protein RB595_005520 [Gaeumannomyces hyphopodioides]